MSLPHPRIESLETIESVPPPKQPPKKVKSDGWYPELSVTQRAIFDDPSPYILAYGEKGSGKTLATGGHKVVRHCYENHNALSLIITPTTTTGKEGVLHDLETLVLPAWRDGNREYQDGQVGELIDNGIGLEFTEAKLDPQTKDRVLFIGNRFGGWSKILMKSIPYGSQVKARTFGLQPSQVYVDELQNTDGPEYFEYPSAQLGRRRGITGPQQFLASCNPEGPSHWVYNTFFVLCVDEETGERDPDFAVYHIPFTENAHRLKAGYMEGLKKILQDPIEKRRLIDGEWIDRPAGDAIFKDYFIEEIHCVGDPIKDIGLHPLEGYPVGVSYDPGPVNFSVHMEQLVQLKDKVVLLCFDELNFVGQKLAYQVIVPRILNRMDYWTEEVPGLTFEHISDDDAFKRRSNRGSFDHQEIEMFSKGRIKMKPCPKGKDSVRARIRLIQSLLLSESLYISRPTCPYTVEMFHHLTSKKPKPGEWDPNRGFEPVRSRHIHSFDSLSYFPFYCSTKGLLSSEIHTASVTPAVYRAGSPN